MKQLTDKATPATQAVSDARSLRRNFRRTVRETTSFEQWKAQNPVDPNRNQFKFYLYINPDDMAGVYEAVAQGLVPEDLRSMSEVLNYLAREGAELLLLAKRAKQLTTAQVAAGA